MTYLFYGTENYFIDLEIEKIKEQYKIEDLSISRYDLTENSLDEILEDASTVSLFSEKKLIVVTNAFLFANSTKKNEENISLEALVLYLEQGNPDTQLVFVCSKVNMNKKITKLVKKFGVVKEFTTAQNIKGVVSDLFNGYQVSSDTIELLIKRVGNDPLLLKQECEKLKAYKIEEKEITKKDILEMTHKTIDMDIFKLIDHIILKEKESALETYHEMLKYNEEPIKLIIMLANQFRLMYQTKTLIKMGYREDEIAKKLNVHPYPVKLALQKGRNYPEERLLCLLSKLADLDYHIKSGKIEKELGLDLFIMEL